MTSGSASRPVAKALAEAVHRSCRDPRRFATIIWILLAVMILWGLWYTPTPTGDSLGIRRFRTPEIADGIRIAQRFVMTKKNLSGVEVRPVIVGPVGGAFTMTLTDLTSRTVVRATEVPASDVASNDPFIFEVDPMPASSDRQFELAIAPSPGASAHGVAFWATKGERLDDAVLLINGVERWADLAFRTRTSSASLLTRLMQPSGSQGLRPWMASAGALVAWLLIGVALRAVATLPHDDAFGATLQ